MFSDLCVESVGNFLPDKTASLHNFPENGVFITTEAAVLHEIFDSEENDTLGIAI
jgi:hypothetical protein